MTTDLFKKYDNPKYNQLLKNNPQIKEEINNFFSSYGIKSFEKRLPNESFDESIRKDLTLFSFENFNSLRMINTSSSMSSHIDCGSIYTNIIYQAYNEGEILYSKHSSNPIAVYFKERNILLLTPDILNCLNYPNCIETLKKFLDELKDILKDVKFEKVNINNYIQNKFIKTLKQNLNNSIVNTKSNIRELESEIGSHFNSYITMSKTKRNDEDLLVLYDKMSKDFDKNVKKNLKELNSLKFLKSWEITSKGLEFHFGKISYKGDISQDETPDIKNCYLGDFTFIVDNQFKIVNKHPLKIWDGIYAHMHSGRSTCWGDFLPKITELINSCEFKQLCMLIYSWLNSYNPNDKIVSFDKFYKAREVEGKFDENGKILKTWKKTPKETPKKICVGTMVRIRENSPHYSQRDSVDGSIITSMNVTNPDEDYRRVEFSNGYSNSYRIIDLEVME